MSDQVPTDSILLAWLEKAVGRIVKEVEGLTGLRSGWNHKVELIPSSNVAFGGKTFGCLIRLRADLAGTEHGWLTLIHEVLHSFSVGRSPDGSLNYAGYEEGVVESLQRLFRQEVLASLGIVVSPRSFVDRDLNSAYTDYVNALETMRLTLGREPKGFYTSLLGTPLEQRASLLREQAEQYSLWSEPGFRRGWRKLERVLASGVIKDATRRVPSE